MTDCASTPQKLCILGTGSWGLTLAWMTASSAAKSGSTLHVTLWGRNAEKVAAMQANRNIQFPLEMTLPDSLTITADLGEAINDADAVIFVVTSAATRDVADAVNATGKLKRNCIVVNASKGIEYPSLKPMADILKEVLPEQPVAVLSGPTLAKEVLQGLPTACVVSAESIETSEKLQTMLSCERQFRLYTNTDIRGVEFAGALKNVFAIASGFMTAKQFGDNAKAALLTRGLAEMARFCHEMGAEDSTIYGLAGLGDLLATCNSPLSRNFQVGYRLGKGETLENILKDMKVVAEGVHTARAVYAMSQKMGLDTPIVELVVNAVSGAPISKEMMIRSLMNRKLKSE